MKLFRVNKENFIAYSLLLFMVFNIIFCGNLLFNTYWGDPTIYLVYAKNIANGYFFSFNQGEFSSGATSPLWAIILSIGFIYGNNGIILSKVISLIFTALSLLVLYYVVCKISKSAIGSSMGVGFLFYFLVFPGLMGYESSFIIILISILIVLNFYLIQKHNNNFLWCIGIIWALMPLVRPESIIIIIINILILILKFRNNKQLIFKVLLISFLSILPSALYFSYSYTKLGVISTSSYCRALALGDVAKIYGPLYFWPFYNITMQFNVIIGLIICLVGYIYNRKKLLWLVCFNLTVLISYILIFTIYSPVINLMDAQRYILPVIPFIAISISCGTSYILSLCKNKFIYNFLILSLIIVMIILPSSIIISECINQSNRGLNFDVIVEKNPVNYLNSIAENNATVLIYEVQDRYYLRSDLKVISLDGITDAKIAPYFTNHDITGFLWKYKPKYWIANDCISRPFFSNTILRDVIMKTSRDEGNSIQIDGITFKNIKTRDEPSIRDFSGYEQIYELKYN